MKSVPKLIHRFFLIMFLGIFLFLFVNLAILYFLFSGHSSNSSPWTTARETAQDLSLTSNGYILSEPMWKELEEANAWAMLIDEETKTIVWHTPNLPHDLPQTYNLSSIALLTRGYLNGFPTFTGERDDGLLVVGYPPQTFWKHMWPSWDYNLISHFPQIFCLIIGCNLLLIFLIYFFTNTTLIRSIHPLVSGIQKLSTEQEIHIPEQGILCEIAVNINRAAEILKTKNRELQRKETARANWISGVSHDIRTPLSMVMGYAGQLEADPNLTEEQRKKASVIRRQSERMKALINDLNLSSKLEYNMQPLHCKRENAVSLVRQVAVDFINMDIENRYPIEWLTEETLACCMIHADRDLIKRAVSNLIQNSINHNENGCHIYVTVAQKEENCLIRVDDDGVGAEDYELERLNHTPHYMFCDTNTADQRHGLGLLIVRQIASVHKGSVLIEHSPYGGFSVSLVLPCSQ